MDAKAKIPTNLFRKLALAKTDQQLERFIKGDLGQEVTDALRQLWRAEQHALHPEVKRLERVPDILQRARDRIDEAKVNWSSQAAKEATVMYQEWRLIAHGIRPHLARTMDFGLSVELEPQPVGCRATFGASPKKLVGGDIQPGHLWMQLAETVLEFANEKSKAVCVQCGNTFTPMRKGGRRRFCSSKCRMAFAYERRQGRV